jgi:serine O-acetyltransferase
LGANIRINADVVIGENNGEDNVPMIGNSVVIEPGAKIFGKSTIADGSHIGANSVVNKSFNEPNVVIVGAPARVVGRI